MEISFPMDRQSLMNVMEVIVYKAVIIWNVMMAIGIQICLSVKVISPTLTLLRKMRCSSCHEQEKIKSPTVVDLMTFYIPFGCLNYRATAETQARSFHNLDAYFQCWVILRL